ncbi:hypothetical protein Acr_13g0003270 [Actinidia rufa]|uniref:Carrier domain-containing protein n=1 Tax=Actinidia rufa TaxID=165716 RepID=A0A7J0FKF1_9ERIC|nr:hypothetical protein Acr_13g0003270 [Actinidia rufa]
MDPKIFGGRSIFQATSMLAGEHQNWNNRRNITLLVACVNQVDIEGKIYDLGGQVLAANSAPVIFNLAKEIGSELVELDSHKLALIDSSTGKYQDIKVADDYVSVISLTLELQDSGRIGVHAISDFASDLTPVFLEDRGFKSVPKSVAYGYTASGYGFVQDMPYAYIHEFTRTSMAGKIRRFKDGYMSLWQKISEALPVKVHCNSEVLAVRRSSCGVSVDVRNSCEEVKLMEFDKIIISGSFPFKNGKTYRSSQSNLADMKEGFYDKLETQLQVCKHFASDTSLPVFPYVKRLIQLQSDCWDRNPKELREYQGVDFPDLCSLDGYLKHWGSHKVTQKKTLYTWINEEGGPAYKRTYGELHANASCIAQKLLGSRKPVIKPARVLPVPVLPPDPLQRGGQALLKIENIAKSCNAVAILSTIGYHGAVRAGAVKNLILLSGKNRKSSGKWPDLPWLHTDSWVKNSKNMLPEDIDDSEAQASDLCFLQFTSGSTGDAKGVMITHGGLIHNVKLMRKRYKSTSNTVLVSWLPQYHDMGLIGGLFTAMAAKDRLWNYDLSSMVFLMVVAAEPVRQKTLKRFVELTSSFGLSQKVMAPGYGLAENYDVDVDIRIVDPETGVEREEAGKEGEIWISSPSAGIGYWGREELNVEKTVESSSELIRPGCCAVIGVPEDILSTKGMSVPDSSDQVGLVVIAEVRDGKPVPKDVIEHIQTRVAEEHGVTVASVKLIKPRTIRKIYDLGGQVLAANSAPVIFSLAKEIGSELVELDSHKLALIDSSTGKYQDIKVADDYVSVISLTLELQDKTKDSGRIGVHAISDFASDLTPVFLEDRGFKSVPKSVAYGYTASGYGFVQDMPYAYIHEFTRTSMAGKIRSYWTMFSEDAGRIVPKCCMFVRITELAIDALKIMGGMVEKVILQRRFTYFPHVRSQDMKEGFYDKLETQLQGQQNTYYVGGLMAFELTERNSSYAMALVCKHFASDTSLPVFPYVKHWGSHKVTQNKTLYTWINEEGGPAYKRTYGELHANASCIAQKLLGSRKPVIKPARVLPVPVLPPDPLQRGGQALLKIENIAKSCNAVAILSTIGYHGAVRAAGAVKNLILLSGKNRKSSGKWPDLPWLHTDSWVKNSKNMLPEDIDDSEAQASDLCFLQFTSGSTGDAKGVMITHGGLIHNVKLMRKRYKSTSNTVLVSWLPQYHDMGLIGGLFTAMVSGGSAVLFSPITFIKNPLLWLQIMSKYQATHSAGPNFAFELVVRRLEAAKDRLWNYDLSSMVFLMVAAEPVRQKTLKRFVELTSSFGLSQKVMAPGYGLAENCVFVSCAYGEGKPILVDWQGRVSCGYVNSDDVDVDIRIVVDPETGVEREEAGKEGEIWIKQSKCRNWILGQGGTKISSLSLVATYTRQMLKRQLRAHLNLSAQVVCAVIGVPEDILSTKGMSVPDSSDQVGLVVIAEVRDGKPVPKDVIEHIQTRVAEEHGVTVASVKLIKPRTISKTTSGKIKRFECLKQYADGTLNLVPEPILSKKSLLRSFTTGTCREGKTPRAQFVRGPPSPTPKLSTKKYQRITEFLKGVVSEQTGISINKISVNENLVAYGIDSIGVVRAAQKLSDFLGVPVGAVDIFTATCIEELASFSEDLLKKSQPKLTTNLSHLPEPEIDSAELVTEVSKSFQLGICLLQLLALIYVSSMLVLPAYLSVSAFTTLISLTNTIMGKKALIQGHEVKNGILSSFPIRIGKNSSVGPYAVIQKEVFWEKKLKYQLCRRLKQAGLLQNPTFKRVQSRKKASVILKLKPCTTSWASTQLVFSARSLSSCPLFPLHTVISKASFPQHFALVCIFGAFHWLPFAIIAYATMIGSASSTPNSFAISIAFAYVAHGLILSFLTGLATHILHRNQQEKQSHLKTWLRHRITIACHLRFARLLSGTETFCMYLRLLGAKVGKHCSIRAINPVSEPELISIGDGVHLGDFSRIIAGFYSSSGFSCGKVEVNDNSVVGSQSLVLPGSVVEKGCHSWRSFSCSNEFSSPKGGVYIGSQSPVMIKNTMHTLDERIEEMDTKYKKIVGNLAANLAATTLKVRTRYFHRIGVSGKGVLKLYDNIKGLPDHKIFHPGKSYPIVVRHSNSLSADDDARIDARGAALRILSDETGAESSELPLLDLTLKTGNAFYARTISDFATWLVCGLPAREEHVKHAPHIRVTQCGIPCAMQTHMLSYITTPISVGSSGSQMDRKYFQRRVNSPGGVHYIFQLQFRPIPQDEAAQDIALDCTKPWDDTEFPIIDVGEIVIDQNLTGEQSEELVFNPFLRCPEIDVIRATSASQSASIDHGRSLIYEICQRLRNGDPLPESWRIFLEQSDVKVNLSDCPMAAALENNETRKVTLERPWYQSLWAILAQPLLQTALPYYLMGLVIFGPLSWVLYLKDTVKYPLHWLLPLFWVSSGILAAFACVVGKWVLVGKKKEDKTMLIWSSGAFMDTIWQAFRTVVGDYFMEMASGSVLFVIWMKLMGSEIDLGAYVDSMEAVLNPEMVEIERGGCVGREALLFGHIYEGEGGRVKFGKISVGEGGFVGSRAVVMPGVRVETGGRLSSLSLAMKEEIVKSR